MSILGSDFLFFFWKKWQKENKNKWNKTINCEQELSSKIETVYMQRLQLNA